MAFDVLSLQRNRGAVQAKSRADEQAGRAMLKYIDVYDLIPSEDNFYSMSAIEELAALIEVSGGVKQPGLAVPLGGGKYKVIAGHRRRLASIFLAEQGKEQYRKMPCMVEEATGEEPENPAEAAELREIDEGILLIATNGQREKTDWERVQEVTRLRELLERKRQHQKIPGQMRKIIAEQLGTTPAQVGRYESITKHLAQDFQAEFAAGRVNVSAAYELSTLPEAEQTAALEEYRQKGALSLEDVRRRKGPEPEQIKGKAEQHTEVPEAAPSPAPAVQKTESENPQAKVVVAGDDKEIVKQLIEHLDDLSGYCAGMMESGDKARDWGEDEKMLLLAVYLLEKGGGAGCR